MLLQHAQLLTRYSCCKHNGKRLEWKKIDWVCKVEGCRANDYAKREERFKCSIPWHGAAEASCSQGHQTFELNMHWVCTLREASSHELNVLCSDTKRGQLL